MNENQDPAKESNPVPGASSRVCRWLFVIACVATLAGLFYTVENWRGKRAWEKCRHELEAKGEVLDWNAYIPATVPDEQNFFKAPHMAEWFVKNSLAEAASGAPSGPPGAKAPFRLSLGWNPKPAPTLLAEVRIVLPGEPLPADKADAVLQLEQPANREEAARLIRERIGASAESVWNGLIIEKSLGQIHPLNLVLQADTMPTTNAIAEFLSSNPKSNEVGPTPIQRYLQVERTGGYDFRVLLTRWVDDAAGYLAASQSAVPDLNLVRHALERPYARIDGDYQRPFQRPFPNFVRIRNMAQLLSQRAKCYLLLGQPEAAQHDLVTVRDLCRILGEPPTGRGRTLVEAMIDVAVTGLYASIVQDGLRLRVWREPELAAIQKQLADINLLPLVRAAFNAERAAACRTFETTSPAGIGKMFFYDRQPRGFWQQIQNPTALLCGLMPRGWLYQNMCAAAPGRQMMMEILDATNNLVLPFKAYEGNLGLQPAPSRGTPYTFLAAMAMPNFLRAVQSTARNQTIVNEAFIACGLERYRLAHGQYPESLNALAPQFVAKLPHDIIGGQPLKYRRTANDRFILYSVGWNGKDDGGVAGKAVEDGDWVWE